MSDACLMLISRKRTLAVKHNAIVVYLECKHGSIEWDYNREIENAIFLSQGQLIVNAMNCTCVAHSWKCEAMYTYVFSCYATSVVFGKHTHALVHAVTCTYMVIASQVTLGTCVY